MKREPTHLELELLNTCARMSKQQALGYANAASTAARDADASPPGALKLARRLAADALGERARLEWLIAERYDIAREALKGR